MRRFVGHAARTSALAATFAAASGAGLVLHADLPAARRVVGGIANHALDGRFAGRVIIGGVEELSVGASAHVRLSRVEVIDPDGVRALALRGVDARIDLARLLGSLVRGDGVDAALARVRVEDADVVLSRTPDGSLRLARALASTSPSGSAPPHVTVGDLTVAHARVHGDAFAEDQGGLDAEARDVRARAEIARGVLAVDLAHASASLRSPAVLGGPLSAEAKGGLTMPLSDPSRADAHAELDARLAGQPVVARARITAGVIDASVDVPSAAAVLARFAPTSKAPTALHARAKGTLSALAIEARAELGEGAVTAAGTMNLEAPAKSAAIDLSAEHLDARAFGGPASDVGARAHVEVSLATKDGTFRVTTAPSTVAGERVPAVSAEGTFSPREVRARASATYQGIAAKADVALDLARASLRGSVSADARGLTRGPVSLSTAHATGALSGSLTAPVLDVTAEARGVRLAAKGKAPLVYPRATARARVALAPHVRVTGAEVSLAGADGAVTLAADEIRVSDGFAIRGGRVSGLGAPMSLDASTRGGGVAIRARGEGLDLDTAAAMTGIDELRLFPPGSRASVDVDLAVGAGRAQGRADLTITGDHGAAMVELHAVASGRHVTAHGRASLGDAGSVEVARAELDLHGADLARATGAVELRGAIDLAKALEHVDGAPLDRASGVATFEARVARTSASAAPSVRATVTTRGLMVSRGDVTLSGIDAQAHVAYDATNDDTAVALLAWDDRGVLASADAKARAPLAAWARGTRRLDARALESLVASVVAHVPRRPIAELPWMGSRDVLGGLEAHASLTGRLGAPRVSASLEGLGLRNRESGRRDYAPVDVDLGIRWDGEDVVAVITADERGGARRRRRARAPSGHVRGLVLGRVSARDLLRAREPVAWSLSSEVDVRDLALGPLPLPGRLTGALTGHASLRDLGVAPSLEANVRVDDLGVERVRVARADASVDARDGSLAVTTRLRQADGGSADLHLDSQSLVWKSLTPEWDAAQTTRLGYALEGVRLSLLQPLARKVAKDLDGTLDGKGRVVVGARAQEWDGELTVHDGRAYVSAIGEDVSDVTLTAHLEEAGALRVEDARGKIGDGEVRASATGRLSALGLARADVVLVVPEGRAIPLSSEGATFATATGEVRVSARRERADQPLRVAVTVPRAHLELPDRDPQALQSLDPDPAIAVGVRRPDGGLVTVPRGPRRRAADGDAPLETHLSVALGDDVLLEGRGISVYLGGDAKVDIAKEVAVTGQIALKSGSIVAQGRRFVLDHGTVTFAGAEPDNPTVVAAAYWDAPDRTRVWVEFTGPLKTGALTLRSEPPYSKNEILSILLFGRPDPNAATGGGAAQSGSQRARAVGAGLGSTGLNQALRELSDDVDVETDTTRGSRTRTKLNYRVRRNLRIQLGYAGAATQRERDTTYLSVDWQFIPKWSVVATGGDKGTSILDVLYRHRY